MLCGSENIKTHFKLNKMLKFGFYYWDILLIFVAGGVHTPAECHPAESCASQPGQQIQNPQQSVDPGPTTCCSGIQTWQHVWFTGTKTSLSNPNHVSAFKQLDMNWCIVCSSLWHYSHFRQSSKSSVSLGFLGGDPSGGAAGGGSGQSPLWLLSLRPGPLLLRAVRRRDQRQTAQLSGSTLHCLSAAVQRLHSGWGPRNSS